MKGVAIVSGGLDSVTMVHDLSARGDELSLLSFNYNQRHAKELDCARMCAEALGLRHRVINIRDIGEALAPSGSVLVHHGTEVPEGHYAEPNMAQTVVPNRNSIMLNIAVGVAIAEKASYVATAIHAGDHAVYPDCRPQFISSLLQTVKIANEGFILPNFDFATPYVNISKAAIAERALVLGVPLHETWSCYKGGEIHCGRCSTCVERLEAIAEAHKWLGLANTDATEYADKDYWKTVVNA